LKILDLSWNTIGAKYFPAKKKKKKGIKPKKFDPIGHNGRTWGAAVKANETLVHLDLSYNKFEQIDTEIFSTELDSNHTLVGVHYQGNFGAFDEMQGKVDANGFMRLVDATECITDDSHT